MNRDIEKLYTNPSVNVKHNLTKLERDALSDLAKDKDIIIRRADKGSGVVVLIPPLCIGHRY